MKKNKPAKHTKKNLVIDFTKNKDLDFKKIISQQNIKEIIVVDYIYPIAKLHDQEFTIQDHINLSGENPLSGPEFIGMSNPYNTANSKRPKITVAGLKNGVIPNSHELKILKKTGIDAYCYHLPLCAIYARSQNIKVNGLGRLKEN